MKVPFIDLTRFEPTFKDLWVEKVIQLTDQASFIGGTEVYNLENTLAEHVEMKYAITCANGTDALQLALRAIGVGRNDKVLVPNLTFWATFESVVNVNATPICVDSDDEGQLDFLSLANAIDFYQPKAIIIAHLFGRGSNNLFNIRKLCEENKIFLIEDGAQCFGVKYKGNSIFKESFISTTSFYPAKVLGAAGDGGAVFTNDKDLNDKLRSLSNHGRSSHYGYSYVGWNSRLDTFQAAFLNLVIQYLPERIKSRNEILDKYYTALPSLGINVIEPNSDYKENGYCNLCLIADKAFKNKLEKSFKINNIGFGNIYPSVLSEQKAASEYFDYKNLQESNSYLFTQKVLNLPVFPYMTDFEFNFIIDAIKKS
jgi:UDP-2-acetamido-2-deoxy-ribo-hexuluronate aminotransferase